MVDEKIILKLNRTYTGMKDRCYNKNSHKYHIYGALGIKICDEWLRDKRKFIEWSLENGVKDGLSIDRINPSGDYEPSNCRWATTRQQSLNRRDTIKVKYQGKEYTLVELSEMLNIGYATLWARLKVYNFNADKLLDTQKHIIKDKLPKSGERYIYQSKNSYSVQIHKKYYGTRNSLQDAIILRDKILSERGE